MQSVNNCDVSCLEDSWGPLAIEQMNYWNALNSVGALSHLVFDAMFIACTKRTPAIVDFLIQRGWILKPRHISSCIHWDNAENFSHVVPEPTQAHLDTAFVFHAEKCLRHIFQRLGHLDSENFSHIALTTNFSLVDFAVENFTGELPIEELYCVAADEGNLATLQYLREKFGVEFSANVAMSCTISNPENFNFVLGECYEKLSREERIGVMENILIDLQEEERPHLDLRSFPNLQAFMAQRDLTSFLQV